LSADSISNFLSSADFFFVSKCLCGRHLNDAHAGIVWFAPACFLTEMFSTSAGAHFRFYHDSIPFAGPSCNADFTLCIGIVFHDSFRFLLHVPCKWSAVDISVNLLRWKIHEVPISSAIINKWVSKCLYHPANEQSSTWQGTPFLYMSYQFN
jgi:hypothetical protein